MKMGYRSVMVTLAVVVLLAAWRVPAGAQCPRRTTTTSTSSTTTTSICVATSGTFCDLGNETVYDSATALQWEKKDTAWGSGVNAADLHDVDNYYRWVGSCSGATAKRCQPNAAAETACKAQTAAAYWGNGCEQCVGGEGTCTVTSYITTAWNWVSQVNAANFAGHSDWRLPSEDGCDSCHELVTILLAPASIFGPTSPYWYWSSSTYQDGPANAWVVLFDGSEVFPLPKPYPGWVRAVRGGSCAQCPPTTTTTSTSSTTTTSTTTTTIVLSCSAQFAPCGGCGGSTCLKHVESGSLICIGAALGFSSCSSDADCTNPTYPLCVNLGGSCTGIFPGCSSTHCDSASDCEPFCNQCLNAVNTRCSAACGIP